MSFTIRCEAWWNDLEDDARATLSWLEATGMSKRIGIGEKKRGKFELEVLGIPNVLEALLKLEDELPVTRITHDGVTFYLTDIPFQSGKNRSAANQHAGQESALATDLLAQISVREIDFNLRRPRRIRSKLPQAPEANE